MALYKGSKKIATGGVVSSVIEDISDKIITFADDGNIDEYDGSDFTDVLSSINTGSQCNKLMAVIKRAFAFLNQNINSVTTDCNGLSNKYTELSNKYTDLSNTISSKTTFLNMVYPVGSIYMSVNSTSPATLFGGTWTQLSNRFLLGAGSTYAAGSTGGSTTHSHLYGLKVGEYYGGAGFAKSSNAGLVNYSSANAVSISTITSGTLSGATHYINGSVTTSSVEQSMNTYQRTANTSYVSTLPPYLTVYMWKRTA